MNPVLTHRRHITGRSPGFALVITLSLMILLSLLAVGMLSLSSVTLRNSSRGAADAEAKANARLAVMLAIGELQKELGPDQRITAPSGVLDSNPATDDLDDVSHRHLTGAWNARNDALGDTPDYQREPSFRRWLVSNSDSASLENLDFPAAGTLNDPVDIAPGTSPSSDPVRAGRVPVPTGRFAYWVGDENIKALANPRDEPDRKANPREASILAGFATPGAHGITALDGLADFPSNTATSDKAITPDTLGLVHPQADSESVFHHLSPYPKSVLASVTRGGLREDLSLYLERADINWKQPWGKEGATTLPSGPLGPNSLLALGDPREYDTLPWKTLHHWAYIHRQQMADQNDLRLTAMNRTTPAPDPISNPAWNSGNTRLYPVVARIQTLISFRARERAGTPGIYDLYLYNFPVVTLWNPYNVPLRVDAMHAWIAKLPLANTVYKNGVKHDLGNDANAGTRDGNYVWNKEHGLMSMNMIGWQNPAITMAPGEAKLFSYTGPWDPTLPRPFIRNRPNEVPPAWLPTFPGLERHIGTIVGLSTDRISVGSALATWENSAGLLGDGNYQTTFEFRTDAKSDELQPNFSRYTQQKFPGQVGWRHEDANPRPDTISQWNLPNSTLADLSLSP